MSDQLTAPADVSAAPADADTTSSGLASKVLQEGSGSENPTARDTVKVHYTGWQSSDGKMFDSSVARGEQISFPLNQVIPGWTEGVQLMVVGEKRRFWIPAELAYGEVPSRPGAPSGDLVFDVELFDIERAPELPETPVDVSSAPDDAITSESGLSSKVLAEGDGSESPGPEDVVKVHFSGWTSSGDFLDSTVLHDGPAQFKLDQVSIKGWVEGLQLMTCGEKRRLWIPAALGFGEGGPAGAPKGDLVFDFELLEFQEAPKRPEPIPAPSDVAAAPEDAQKTDSGLFSKVLKEGSGSEHPQASDEVLVHYTGWTTEGEMFDSSVVRGEPISFPLRGVIAGWTEGVQLMVEGETRRFWIPGNLAYGETPSRPGAPCGMLVFDVELIKIG
ncbi:MAG: FKBP-type peptidyl-prolyl cis-trans isomerase [Verrucomicrobiaceae bacterium]